jgi:hypothetical protein
MKYLLLAFALTSCGHVLEEVETVQGERGPQGESGSNGVDGDDGSDGSNAVAQVTTVSFTNTTTCKEVINESGLVVFGNKASSNTDSVRIYFNSSCTGNNETLSYSGNETIVVGRNLIIISGRNNANPQPLTITRVKL